MGKVIGTIGPDFQEKWTQQHQSFEEMQGSLEQSHSFDEVGGIFERAPGNIGSDEYLESQEYARNAKSIPGGFQQGGQQLGEGFNNLGGAITGMNPQQFTRPIQQGIRSMTTPLTGLNPMGFVQPVMKPIKELKEALLDKTAGLRLDLTFDWKAGQPMAGDLQLSYVKRTGAIILDNLKVLNVIDASFEKSQQLLNFRFAPERKFSWLFEDTDVQQLKTAAKYWSNFVPGAKPIVKKVIR